jgi:hypothetical protein
VIDVFEIAVESIVAKLELQDNENSKQAPMPTLKPEIFMIECAL